MQGTKIGLSSLPQLEFNVSPVRVGNLLESNCTGSCASQPSNFREHNCTKKPAAEL